jgi:predicted ester cyclase
MKPDEIRSLCTRYFREVWDKGNEAVLDEMLAPDLVNHMLSEGPLLGREAFREWYRPFRQAFSEVSCPVTHCFVEGEWSAIRVAFSGKHVAELNGVAPTGKTVKFSALILCRWVNGRVVEAYNEFDRHTLNTQLA